MQFGRWLAIPFVLSACSATHDAAPDAAASAPATSVPAASAPASSGEAAPSTRGVAPNGRWTMPGKAAGTYFVEFADGQVRANAGCNSMGASYTTNADGSVAIGPVTRSKMFCEATMADEDALIAALGATRYLHATDDRLQLHDAQRKVLLELVRE